MLHLIKLKDHVQHSLEGKTITSGGYYRKESVIQLVRLSTSVIFPFTFTKLIISPSPSYTTETLTMYPLFSAKAL